MSSRIAELLTALVLWLAASGAWAQPAPAQVAEREAALAAAREAATHGPSEIPLRDQGTLRLPEGYSFVPQPEAARLLRAIGNDAGDSLLGLVLSRRGGFDWFASIQFRDVGFIGDADARDVNAADLLAWIADGIAGGNQESSAHGGAAVELVGWLDAPAYEPGAHRLSWSHLTRYRGAPADAAQIVNHDVFLLGREGYLELKVAAKGATIEQAALVARELVPGLSFVDGKRYQDFQAGHDRVVQGGLGALITGKTAQAAPGAGGTVKPWELILSAALCMVAFAVLRSSNPARG